MSHRSRVLMYPLLFASMVSYSQENSRNVIIGSIALKLERELGNKYEVWGIEFDKSVRDTIRTHRVFQDRYHTLEGCFIFVAGGEADSNGHRAKGLVGIYRVRSDSILWRSVPLCSDFASGVLGFVSQVREMNRDGETELIIEQGKPPIETRQLWIFSWNGKMGKLITQLDEGGESTIYCYGDYELKDFDGDGILEIRGQWYKSKNSARRTLVTYSWNGSLYGKWEETSKYLLKGKSK